MQQLVEALDGMNRNFTNPYCIFYPTVSRDGMPFPVNRCIREIQGEFINYFFIFEIVNVGLIILIGKNYKEQCAWRGNIVIAKYRESPFSSMIHATMADFPILKNYLMTHGVPSVSLTVDLFDVFRN